MTTEKKTRKTKTNPKGAKVTKEFMFKLSDKESNEKGKASAAIGAEIVEMKAKLKDIVDTHKTRIESRQEARDTLDAVLLAQEEKRTVDAVMVKDYEAREMRFYFEGFMIEARTMTESELQMEANFTKGKRAEKQALKKPTEAERKRDLVEQAHGANGKMADIAEVHSLETKRATKTSAVDGPTRQ